MSETYTGFGELKYTQDDHSTTAFIAGQLMNGMATAALVLVKTVQGDRVSVQPMVNQIDGTGTGIPHGIVNNLPWFSLRAGSSAIIAKPAVGDIGVAIFCHSDSSVVKKTKAVANPGSRRRNDWADGLYLGGFLGPTPTTTITIVDGEIDIVAATIKLTGAVTIDGATTITGDVAITGALSTTGDTTSNGKSLDTHRHTGVATGSGTSGPPA